MFPYYGAKTKVIKHYPPPIYDEIIEPFAGSARYALKYYDRKVTIVDKYDVIIRIWKWLQQCSRNDILSLPRMKYGQHVDDEELDFTWPCDEARDFMGFIIGFIPASPRRTATIRMQQRPNAINYTLNRVAGSLYKIRHWNIIEGTYLDIPDRPATWFIDPPDKEGGNFYIHGSDDIHYPLLREWITQRTGQIIACESHGADWMRFTELVTQHVRGGNKTELVYLNQEHQTKQEQLKICTP